MKSAKQKNQTKTFILNIDEKCKDLKEYIFRFLVDERKIQIKFSEMNQIDWNMKSDQVEILVPKSFLKRKAETIITYELSKEAIIFEDDDIIIVNKPSGLPTQATLDPKRDHLFAAVKRYLKKECYLHHRLDVETSGLVLFCKNKQLNKAVGEMFEKKTIQKNYLAVCSGEVKSNKFQVENFLAKMNQKTLKMHSVFSGGDKALTDFEVISKSGDFTLIKASPKTGRTHQIRVHLSELGLPIYGDKLYGSDQAISQRLMLHALELDFLHPKTQNRITVSTPIPEEFSKIFNQLV